MKTETIHNIYYRVSVPLFFLISLVLISDNICALELPTLDAGAMFNYWKSDKSDKGMQAGVPISAEESYRDFDFSILNAFVYTKVSPDSAPDASLTGFLDTKLNLSYDLKDRIPVDILFGLGFNLPTGKTNLSNNQLVLIADPDLMPIITFGEGFNVNPYVSVSKQWEKFVVGIGAGYNYRGKYDFSEALNDYKPGNIITASLEAGYDITDSLHTNIFGEYAYTDTDTVSSNDYYKEGNLYIIGLGGGYAQPSWRLDVNLTSLIRSKSKFLSDEDNHAQILEPAKYNNHGVEYDAGIIYKYFLNELTAFGAGVDFAYIGKNDYSSDSPYYIGNRTKVALKGGIDRRFMDKLKGTASLSLFTIKEERDWEHPDGSRTYYGGTLTASVSYTF
jgi:hypothetical protein